MNSHEFREWTRIRGSTFLFVSIRVHSWPLLFWSANCFFAAVHTSHKIFSVYHI